MCGYAAAPKAAHLSPGGEHICFPFIPSCERSLQLFRNKKGLLIFIGCTAFLVVKAVLLWATLSPESQTMAQGLSMMERMSPSLSPLRPQAQSALAARWP